MTCKAKTKSGKNCSRKSVVDGYCTQHYKIVKGIKVSTNDVDYFDPDENEESQTHVISKESVGEDKRYEENVFPHVFGDMKIGDNHCFNNLILKDNGTHPNRTKRISKELRFIKNNLPVHFNSTIAVRVDEVKFHVMKAIIFAPNDTPYDGGCFEFDIYFPSDYPHVPPKMLITTTGGGRIRFNPNLYSNGKVCLSLLGTWRGRNAQENWTKKSSIWQVLISVQSSILGEKYPFFNEPGMERERGTTKGERNRRVAYNGGYERLREYTMRYAMIEQIKKCPRGFEELVRNHFKYKSDYIKMVTYNWFLEALESDTKGHAERINNLREQLIEELDKL